MLNHYYVNKQAQPNGDHEIHKYECTHGADFDNQRELGWFSSDRDALNEALKIYPQSDGCMYCCLSIHRH